MKGLSIYIGSFVLGRRCWDDARLRGLQGTIFTNRFTLLVRQFSLIRYEKEEKEVEETPEETQ